MARAPSTFRQQDVSRGDMRRQSRPEAVERPRPSRRARCHPVKAGRTYALKLKPPGERQNAAHAALRAVAQLDRLELLYGRRRAPISADRVLEQPQ
jgi:hypothetical protein